MQIQPQMQGQPSSGNSHGRLQLTADILRLVHQSQGTPLAEEHLAPAGLSTLSLLREAGAGKVLLHNDRAAHAAAETLGAHAFCLDGRIYLGRARAGAPAARDTLSHELVHVLQTRLARVGRPVAATDDVETEADFVASGRRSPRTIRYGASPGEVYGLWWLAPLAAAAYTLLRPSTANAPTHPSAPTCPSTPPLQVAGEAFALFAVPGGAMRVAGSLRLGFFSTGALVGGSTTVGLRAVEDLGRGELSSGQVYVIDAATGALVGMVVPGGIRLVGRAGTRGLDWLATKGLRHADLALTRQMFQSARVKPLADAEVDALLARASGWIGSSSSWWLNRRGQILLYRGQRQMTSKILSPMARDKGIPTSHAMVERLRKAGVSDGELAHFTASVHRNRAHPVVAPPGFAGEQIGAAGIPTTRIPGVASSFGGDSVVYVIRLPASAAIKVPKWGLSVENEWVVLHHIPDEAIISVVPASRIPPLTADLNGKLVPGR